MTTLSSLCDVIDCEHRTAPTSVSGYPLIRTPDIGVGRLNVESALRVDEETYQRWTKRAIPRAGDLILAREAPVGNVGIVLPGVVPVLGQRTVLIRTRSDLLDPYYLNYLLSGPAIRGWMEGVSTGATVPHLNVADIRAMELPPLPPIETQKKIAAVLSSYDALAENNNCRIKLLEQMARQIYREWFVKFRYPGHKNVPLVHSEIGPVPDGWTAGVLADLVVINANTIRTVQPDEYIRYIDISSVTRGVVEPPKQMLLSRAPGRARRRIASGDTIWSTVRPNLRAFALVLKPGVNLVASTGFAVLTPQRASFSYIYCMTTTDQFVEYVSGRATGSAYPAVTAAVFERAPALIPPARILEDFANLVEPLLRMASALDAQSNSLRAARNLLLPRLISGESGVANLEIRLPDAAA